MSEEDHPLVSVVVLNYNGMKYLKKTVPPILKLNYPNYEFIIVDNGSTDESIEYISGLNKINLIENKKNLGYSKGKNIGVKNAKGAYVLLLDNDMLIKNSDMLLDLMNIKNRDSSLIQPLFSDCDKDKTTHYGIFFSIYGTNWHKKAYPLELIPNKELYQIGSVLGGAMFFKKEIFENIGYFDESQMFNLDDFDIGARAYIFGYNCYLYSTGSLIHLGVDHSSSAENYARRFRLMFSGKARSIVKNYEAKNIAIIFPTMFLFQFIKSIRYSIKKRSMNVFLAFVWSVGFFVKNLPDTLKQRKIIQSKRVVKNDVFLTIEPLKFD